jgi:hypothetical protein
LEGADEVVVRDSFQILKFGGITCVGTKGLGCGQGNSKTVEGDTRCWTAKSSLSWFHPPCMDMKSYTTEVTPEVLQMLRAFVGDMQRRDLQRLLGLKE